MTSFPSQPVVVPSLSRIDMQNPFQDILQLNLSDYTIHIRIGTIFQKEYSPKESAGFRGSRNNKTILYSRAITLNL